MSLVLRLEASRIAHPVKNEQRIETHAESLYNNPYTPMVFPTCYSRYTMASGHYKNIP